MALETISPIALGVAGLFVSHIWRIAILVVTAWQAPAIEGRAKWPFWPPYATLEEMAVH